MLRLAGSRRVAAQTIERVTFEDAVRRAVTNHPTVRQAAADILRARGDPAAGAGAVAAVGRCGVHDQRHRAGDEFGGRASQPRTQTVTTARWPCRSSRPVSWAERNQAADQVLVSQRAAEDARRRSRSPRRGVSGRDRAAARARAERAGARQGARALRVRQPAIPGRHRQPAECAAGTAGVLGDEARVEEARLAVRRAQEALGVLIAADGPVDAGDDRRSSCRRRREPDAALIADRQDVQLIAARQTAAQAACRRLLEGPPAVGHGAVHASGAGAGGTLRRLRVVAGGGPFQSSRSSIRDSAGPARERRAFVDVVRAERSEAERQAASEIRTAREAWSAHRAGARCARSRGAAGERSAAGLRTSRSAKGRRRTSR